MLSLIAIPSGGHVTQLSIPTVGTIAFSAHGAQAPPSIAGLPEGPKYPVLHEQMELPID